ncbi:hypothetical protein [Rhodothermus profundi]|uniref:Uncharacterized protein n=1 Tax=Rhodothermus profundi TaxID=633813 RepID=A0A1M6RUB5_9BACT|nr:hypothetical protein [Rhodothermus profundi]SHK36035.1 hypothetical protein SAMN04488087_0965 [Rhodothermus profundi]
MGLRKYRSAFLSREDFERVWRVQFERLFYVDSETGLPVWFPHQIFRIHGKFLFYTPSYSFLSSDYARFEEVLSHYEEKEFVVVDVELLESNSENVGIIFQLGCDYEGLNIDYLEWIPFEFLIFGRRHDWAFVSSDGYNIMVLCAEGALWDAFSKVYPGVSRARLEEYLSHCPDDYRDLFEMNYLRREGD